jgi:hypothetical protein
VQLRNQWQDGVHILDSFIEGEECPEVLDFFVLGTLWVALLCLHVFDLCHQVIGINLVPEGRFPSLKLEVNQGDEIPHLLEVLEISSTVFQCFV